MKELLAQLSEEQIDIFLSIVSEELKTTQNEVDIILTLQILAPSLWPRLDEAPRLRTENILLKSITRGQGRVKRGVIGEEGVIGTWAKNFLQYFDLKSQAGQVILAKLKDDEPNQRYVFHYFLDVLPCLYETTYRKHQCVAAITDAIKNDDEENLATQMREHYWSYPVDWQQLLDEGLPDLMKDEEIPF